LTVSLPMPRLAPTIKMCAMPQDLSL